MASLSLLCKKITSATRRDANNILSFLCNTCLSLYSTWEKEDEKNETQHVKREEVSSVRINFLRCSFFQCVFMQRNCSDTSHKKADEGRCLMLKQVEKKKKDQDEEDGKRMSLFYDSMNDMIWMNLITSLSINSFSFWLQQSHSFLHEREVRKRDISNITLGI